MIKYFIKKIRRAYWRFMNADPIRNCQLYKDKGCVHVDGPICDFPHCSMMHDHMGVEWISCVECIYRYDCSSTKYGLGCHEGEKEQQ